MRMRVTLFISFIWQTVCWGQASNLEQVLLNQEYHVNEVLQDKHGFLWLGTNRGLLMYNGYEEISIDYPGMSDLAVTSLYLHSHDIWVGYENGKIGRVHDHNRQLEILSDSLSNSKITGINCNDLGQIVFSTYRDGLFYFDGNEVHHFLEKDRAPNDIYDLDVHGSTVAIATDSGIQLSSIDTWQNSVRVFLDSLPDQVIEKIVFANGDKIVGLTIEGILFTLDPGSSTVAFPSGIKGQNVLDILQIENRVYVVTDQGVYFFASESMLQLLVTHPFGQNIRTFTIDSEFNIWFCTSDGKTFRGSLFFVVEPFEMFSEVQAFTRVEDTFILGTSDGLYTYGSGKSTLRPLINGINVTSIESQSGLLLVGTFSNGLLITNMDGIIVQGLDQKDGLHNNSVLDIEQAGDSTAYVSTLSGVQKIDFSPGGSFKDLRIENTFGDLASNYSLCLFYDQGDRLWVGTDKRGLKMIHRGQLKNFDRVVHIDGSMTNVGSVFSIQEDVDDVIWITSTEAGLAYLDGDTLRGIQTIKNPEDYYTSIIPTRNNNFLLVRSKSADLLDPSRKHLMYFDKEVGLVPELPFMNNYHSDEQGIWFVHGSRMYHFQEPPFPIKIHPETSIDLVEANLTKSSLSKTGYAQNENNLRFHFTGSWLTDPSKLSYSYWLEGYDNDWRYTKDRMVTYQHLTPGDYVFKVKSAENEFFTDEPITEYGFVIHRAYYRTWWFYTLVSGLLLWVLIWFYKRHINERDLKMELKRISVEGQLINLKNQLNPHFLFNSFNTLVGLIEEDQERGVKFTELLTDYYRSNLDVGQKMLVTVKEEVELLNSYVKLLSERFGTGFDVVVDIDLGGSWKIPPMTLQMLVENAIKHNVIHMDHPLIIRLSETPDSLFVRNNINPKISNSSTGLGLENIKRRYEIIGGESIRVERDSQQFVVVLPKIFAPKNSNDSHNS